MDWRPGDLFQVRTNIVERWAIGMHAGKDSPLKPSPSVKRCGHRDDAAPDRVKKSVRRRSGGGEAEADCEPHEAGHVIDPKLLHYTTAIRVDARWGQVKSGRNLLARPARDH